MASAANDLREEFSFAHTFDTAVASHYKVGGEGIVVVNAPRFDSKYEPKFYSLKKVSDYIDTERFFSKGDVYLLHLPYSFSLVTLFTT